jgi:hypothetical protein
LRDVVGNDERVEPEQIGETLLKTGIVPGLTVIVSEVIVAHCPSAGVNVYIVVAVLFRAGDHDPVIPFKDVIGKGERVSPEQIADTELKEGVTFGLTIIVIVVVPAHWPAAGVKVYVVLPVLAVFIAAGLQVPVIAGMLVELAGRAGGVEFWHSGPIWVNVGVILVVTRIFIVAVAAHCPAFGVKV